MLRSPDSCGCGISVSILYNRSFCDVCACPVDVAHFDCLHSSLLFANAVDGSFIFVNFSSSNLFNSTSALRVAFIEALVLQYILIFVFVYIDRYHFILKSLFIETYPIFYKLVCLFVNGAEQTIKLLNRVGLEKKRFNSVTKICLYRPV